MMRMSRRAKKVLNALTPDWQYPLDIAKGAKIPLNFVYGALDKLDDFGYIEQTWDFTGDRPRHMVRLSEKAMKAHV